MALLTLPRVAIVVLGPLLAGLVACYAPELRECKVACTSDSDCATGHACGRGLCVSPDSTCAAPMSDAAGTGGDDAVPDDAPTTPATGLLRVEIHDHGSVDVAGVGICVWTMMGQHCDFVVELGVTHTLTAIPDVDRGFDRWEKACLDEPTTTCTLVPSGPQTDAKARFGGDAD